jgi:spermidine/putrescine transport system permease protein
MSTRTSVVDRVTGDLDLDPDRSTLLLIPLVLFEVSVFLVPLLLLLRFSLYETGASSAYVDGTFTLQSYINILTSEYIHGVLLFTLKLALVSTIISVGFGLFYAYAIWRADGLLRSVLLLSMVLPLFVTLVVKIYAWSLLMSPNGVTNQVLVGTGILGEPVSILYSFWAVVIGQVYITLPYAVLAIYSVLSTMDWQIVEAARDLGASRPRSFVEVVLPEVVPGLIVASVLTFAWGVGAFAAPSLLGGGKQRTIAVEVHSLLLTEFNWPAATALSVFVLVIVVLTVFLQFKLLNSRGEGMTDV